MNSDETIGHETRFVQTNYHSKYSHIVLMRQIQWYTSDFIRRANGSTKWDFFPKICQSNPNSVSLSNQINEFSVNFI